MFDDCDIDVGTFVGESDDELYELTRSEYERAPLEPDRHVLPEALDRMPPGPYLAAILSAIDLSRLSGSDAVTVLRARQRLASHDQAGIYQAMVEVSHRVDPDTTDRSAIVEEYAPEEIGAALTMTRRAANHSLGVALDLYMRLPQVGAALHAGTIDDRRAKVISRHTEHLEAEAAVEVVGRVLQDAARLTTGQLAARLRRMCIEADPEEASRRYEQSLSERRVVAEENPEGTAALLGLQCSPDRVYAARNHINMLARRLKTDDEPRTIDQLRADVMMGLLTGELNGSRTRNGSVDIHVDLTTLVELDDRPGDLGGYGPVIAEIARKVAGEQVSGTWQATVTDPETGEPLHTVVLRRRPSAAQQRKIRANHPTCVFPGCRMPAINCDLDHRIDHARGGPTTVANHAPLCRRHHMAKHHGGWRYRKISKRSCEWRSPLGRTYLTGRPP